MSRIPPAGRPAVRLALALVVAVLLGLGAWVVWGADASDEEAPAPVTGAATVEGAVLAEDVTVAGVQVGAGEVSANVTNRAGVRMDRVVVRFDLYSGGAPAGDASAVAFGVAPGATVRVSSEVPGPVAVDSVVVRETVGTPALN